MKNNDLLEDLKAFRTPICEELSAKIPYTDELADYLTDKGYRKQVEGEWVKHELWEHDYICSVCGKYAPEDDYHDCCIRTDYCPNCGARMKGE